jgi:serine/threonine protein kinase
LFERENCESRSYSLGVFSNLPPCLLCSIIYRDLKPDNVGFDVRGDVKIFDFGLAKEIDPRQMDAEGTYKLTADTGSLRYMAPEGKK